MAIILHQKSPPLSISTLHRYVGSLEAKELEDMVGKIWDFCSDIICPVYKWDILIFLKFRTNIKCRFGRPTTVMVEFVSDYFVKKLFF